jgi:hypothetical protein
MTATVELSDSLVEKAKMLSGISDFQKLIHKVTVEYVRGTEFRISMMKLKEEIGDTDPFWEGYDPKAYVMADTNGMTEGEKR